MKATVFPSGEAAGCSSMPTKSVMRCRFDGGSAGLPSDGAVPDHQRDSDQARHDAADDRTSSDQRLRFCATIGPSLSGTAAAHHPVPFARRRCREGGVSHPSRDSAAADDEWSPALMAAAATSPVRARGWPRSCPRPSRPRTRFGRSAFRRARSRTPRCRCACRPACPRACSGTHVGGGAEDRRPRASRRPSPSATA